MTMPQGWVPPDKAYEAVFDPPIVRMVAAQYGVQGEPVDWDAFNAELVDQFARPDGPDHVERAAFTDRRDRRNFFFSAYWRDARRHAAWTGLPEVAAYWASPARTATNTGYWRETMLLPPDRFEMIVSHGSEKRSGAAALPDTCPRLIPSQHGYYGAMRDRIPAAAGDNLVGAAVGASRRTAAHGPDGRRLRVRAPRNLCVIRSGQDWRDCRGAERDTYFDKVHPVLTAGMRYLDRQGEASGCLSCRFATEIDAGGAELEKSFGLAHFVDLAALEGWAASHPTHTRIFSVFMGMLAEHDYKTGLRLWHEVFVLDGVDDCFEYYNCHGDTGLLASLPGVTF